MKKSNLRFLLALGNHKVVVVEETDRLDIYSNHREHAEKNRVSVERITSAVLSR